MDNRLQLTVASRDRQAPLELDVRRAWNGGWAGRDQESVRRHVEEMREHGVPAPTVTPIWFPLANHLVTTSDRIQVTTEQTSGEIEYALLLEAGHVYVTVASDHSDRGFERHDIQASKQLCPNVIAAEAWPLHECEDHWDQLVVRCWITVGTDRRLYQQAELATLISARRWLGTLEKGGIVTDGLVFLSGTPSTIGGLAYGDAYELELHDPVERRSIRHRYEVEVLGPGHQ